MIDWIGLPKRCFTCLSQTILCSGTLPLAHTTLVATTSMPGPIPDQYNYLMLLTLIPDFCLFFRCSDYFWFQCKVYGVQLGHPWSLSGNPSYRCARSTKQANNQNLMKIKSSTQRYCGFDCLCLSINTIGYWICKIFYNCFVPGRQERSHVPRISGHAEMVCNFTLTDIQFDSSWKLGWLGEENIAHTGWFPNCASPFSVPK